jgi:hypothetical protein
MWAADDDVWSLDFISTLANELEMYPNAGVAMCAVKRVGETGTKYDIIRFDGGDNPNYKGLFEMATLVAAPPKKYNLFICGLFRTNILRQTMALYPDEVCQERLLLCPIALSFCFRYVDRVLFTKTVYDKVEKREWRTGDAYSEKGMRKWKFLKWIQVLSRAVLRLPDIPWHRKIYLIGPIFYKIRWKFTKISFKAVLLSKVRNFFPT